MAVWLEPPPWGAGGRGVPPAWPASLPLGRGHRRRALDLRPPRPRGLRRSRARRGLGLAPGRGSRGLRGRLSPPAASQESAGLRLVHRTAVALHVHPARLEKGQHLRVRFPDPLRQIRDSDLGHADPLRLGGPARPARPSPGSPPPPSRPLLAPLQRRWNPLGQRVQEAAGQVRVGHRHNRPRR